MRKRLSDSVDLMSFYGAGVLAGTVERYWHERGHTNVIVERVEIFEGTWGVRSNLVAGLPLSSPLFDADAEAFTYPNGTESD